MPQNATAQFNPNLGVLATALDRLTLVEQFLTRPGINADKDAAGSDTYNSTDAQLFIDKNDSFEVLGTNATSALVTHSALGGVTLTTAGASGDQIILAPHLNSGFTLWTAATWGTGARPAYGTRVYAGSNIASATYWAGLKLTNTSVTATDNDQVFFRYQDSVNSGKWQAVYSVGGTDYELDTGVTVAASTAYKLEINVDADRIARFYINDQLVNTASVALTASTNLIPYVGVQAGAAAAKALSVRAIVCSKDFA